jgi:putative ABC transport system permease protein
MSRPSFALLVRKNLLRRPARNLILVLCLAAVVGMQVSAELLERASRRGLELGLSRLGADLVAVPRGLSEELTHSFLSGEAGLFYMDRSLEQQIAARPFVARTSAQVYLKSLAGAACCSAWEVFLIGFDPATDFTVQPWLDRDQDRVLGPDEVIVGAALAAPRGTPLKFYGRRFQIAGSLAATGTGLDRAVFIPMAGVYRMAEESRTKAEQELKLDPSRISAVMIKLKPAGQGGLPAFRAAYELEMKIPRLSILQPEDFLIKTQKNLAGTLRALRSASLAIWPVAALLIGLVFALAVHERRRELGLLRALGATRGFVFRMIAGEALVIAGIGTAAGMAGSLGLFAGFSRLLARSLEVPISWPPAAELARVLSLAIVLALLTGVASALIPAAQSSRMEPDEAIRRGE